MNRAKHWTAEQVLNTVRAFQAACVLTAAAELNIFGTLQNSPMTAESLAAKLGADPRAATVLLDALAALSLLKKDNKDYSVTPQVAELLSETGRRSVLPGVLHLGNCLRRWSQLARVVQTGEPAERSSSIRGEAADMAAFIGAMDNFSAPTVSQTVDRLQPLTFRHLLDVAGASGTWTIAFLRAVPQAGATLFDLPEVIPFARQRIAEADLTDRVRFVAGDFFSDELPTGADFAWLSGVAHQNSREQNRALFARIHSALQENATLVIRDVVMDECRTEPVAGALFAVNMLAATEGGGTYTFGEFREDLLAAGFSEAALVQQDEHTNSLIRATKS
jgi:hypothetical protein